MVSTGRYARPADGAAPGAIASGQLWTSGADGANADALSANELRRAHGSEAEARATLGKPGSRLAGVCYALRERRG